MDYEKKYKEALEIARKINSGEGVAAPPDWTSYEVIFPELKENKDERIRKAIKKALQVRCNGSRIISDEPVTLEEAIAWLEKQGKEVTNINGEDYGIDSLYHAIKILERTVGRVTGYQSDDGILSHEAAIDAVKELYKKQGRQEHFSDFNANDWYVSKVDGKIHKITYNPTDKFEPKFRVGDFIANDYCSSKVIEITNDGYLLDTGQGIPFSCEHNAHLWTINDAKDGDVLVTPSEISSESNEQIFLFKAINNRDYVDNCIEYYGCVYDGVFHKNKTGYMGTTLDTFYPATKEQCDMLFQKMKEAGYEWDSEKKELKKIEPKKLNADEVIAWLVANILDYEYFVKRFKIDFGL